MSRSCKWMSLLVLTLSVLSLLPGGRERAQARVSSPARHPRGNADWALVEQSMEIQEIPEPLPRDCDDVTQPGEDPPACCIYGYVYNEGTPVAGSSVHLESIHGTLDLTTVSGGASSLPYYSADLVSAPLQVSPGDVITITASYDSMVSIRTWTVQSDGQHVDLGLVAGYQATGPLTVEADDVVDPAALHTANLLATEVGGPITEDTTWTLAGSPYIVTSNVLVMSGVRLTIEPGVEVRFNADKALQIDGELIARGTSESPIALTSNAGSIPGAWSYILFTDTSVDATYDGEGNYVSGSIIQYAVVEYAGGASINDNGALRTDASSPYVDHTTIRHSASNGICTFNGAVPKMTYNTINNNSGRGINAATDGAGTVRVSNNTIADNSGGGITAGSAMVTDNIITGNSASQGGGIYFTGNGTISGNIVTGNSASTDGGGIWAFYDDMIITDNIIVDNFAAWSGGAIWASYSHPGSIEITHNIIADNSASTGGGIYSYFYPYSGPSTMNNNAMLTNSASSGAAIYFVRSEATIMNNTITRNALTSEDDGVIFLAGQPTLNQNNVYDNIQGIARYELYNSNAQGSADVNAENNWWGTTSSAEILALIWDWFDDSSLGIVDYNPFRSDHNTAAPISPPTGLAADADGTSITLNWSPNPESDLAGYKVYYDTDGAGFPYEGSSANEGDSPIDVGNVTSFSLTGLAPDTYHLSVVAYDTGVDGLNDQTDGNESWFAPDQKVQVGGALAANFSATPTNGTAPLTVDFTDASIGAVNSWSWTFGDGGTSTEPNPAHTYGYGGIYTVSLTVNGPGGSDTETKADYITVEYPPPSAEFSASPLAGAAPLTVTFTDGSSGPIVVWDWDFGDGGVSGARHPQFPYADAGIYTVSLTVTGPGGSDTEAKADYITASEPGQPVAIIDSITPNPAVQGQHLVYFNGSAWDTDEGGDSIIAYLWTSNMEGEVGFQEDFTVQASELSAGTHTITFRAQDDEGEWSPEATGSLTVLVTQAEVRTLILVNHQRLAELYSTSEADQVLGKLKELAAHSTVKGLVVQVEEAGEVAAAYAAWDTDPTNTVKANAVTEAIKTEVDAQWVAHPDLEYLVIVGDDRVIPFRRVLDQTRYPERKYQLVLPTSTTGAALQDDMTLTNDYYADAVPTVPDSKGWDGHELYIPDLGIGRLIETPAEIVAQIDAFLVDEEITAAAATVTGYDFVEDGAQGICSVLSGDGLSTDCSLIGQGWDGDDFIAGVLDTRHEIVSINGHAHHYVMGTPSGSVSSGDVVGAGADHSRALFYTVGCHSGLNISPANPYNPLDMAQALARQRANYVANTGYGWGYVSSIGLSEQLMLDFSERLVYGQSATIGQALAAAKQEYYLNEGEFDYYDEKILIESTLYGLPLYLYSTPTAATEAEEEGAKVVKEERLAELGDGLTVNSLSYQFPMLLEESTENGAYYSFGGLVHTGDGEPIQPKYTVNLSFPSTKAHGVVFKGGLYADVTFFNPVVERAITETLTLAEPSFDSADWYPLLVHRLNRLERGDTLVMFLGQFEPQTQKERVYDGLSFDIYYHINSDDWTAPEINCINSRWSAGVATVSINADDDSGIEVVVVAFTEGNGVWDSVVLTEEGEGLWSGSFGASTDARFFVQVVDGAGNVAVGANVGRYLRPGESTCGTSIFLPLIVRNQ